MISFAIDIECMLDQKNRADFGKSTLIYGTRTPGMLLYRDTLEEWSKRDDISYNVTFDREAPGWTGRSISSPL